MPIFLKLTNENPRRSPALRSLAIGVGGLARRKGGKGCLAVRLFALGIEAVPRNDDDAGGGVRSTSEKPDGEAERPNCL